MKWQKCPTCGGAMWQDYESGMWGKDYYWKCSKKKKHNPECPDKTRYWEDDKGKLIIPKGETNGKIRQW
jgi:hypothetical protein